VDEANNEATDCDERQRDPRPRCEGLDGERQTGDKESRQENARHVLPRESGKHPPREFDKGFLRRRDRREVCREDPPRRIELWAEGDCAEHAAGDSDYHPAAVDRPPRFLKSREILLKNIPGEKVGLKFLHHETPTSPRPVRGAFLMMMSVTVEELPT